MLFDICYFRRKRIKANYLKYLKAVLETVGFFLPMVSSIVLKCAFMGMDKLNLIKMVTRLQTLVNVDLIDLIVLCHATF